MEIYYIHMEMLPLRGSIFLGNNASSKKEKCESTEKLLPQDRQTPEKPLDSSGVTSNRI